jgi:DNA-binding transcriptional regulator YdaS (Cro superfamily)
MGCSQAKISWLLLTAKDLSAEDALAIDRATDGEISASELRPDIWPTIACKVVRTREPPVLER